MSLLIRIPTLLVALGLLVSGGQAKVCDFVELAGIDFHAPVTDCSHDDHSHSHSDTEPCSEGCVVEVSEGVAPAPESVPSLLAAEGMSDFLSVNLVSLSDIGFFKPISNIWHGPPLERPRSLHSDLLFSGRFQV